MTRWRMVAGSLALAAALAGCTGLDALSPKTLNTLNSLLGEYGLNLKTVDATTGQARTYSAQDVQSVVGEDGSAIDYKFESGKMVFRPKKEGKQKITIKFKDGTSQQFTIEGKKSDTRVDGDVAFIPDGSGQGFTTEVGLGGTINVEQRRQELQNAMATKRVKLTVGGANLTGLSGTTMKALYLDHLKAPGFAYEVTSEGALKVDPTFFYLAQQYFKHRNEYPLLRLAYVADGKLTVLVTKLTSLPRLPVMPEPVPGQPAPTPPSPDQFEAGQTLDVALVGTETPSDLATYEQQTGLAGQLPPPGGFQPTDPTQDPYRQQMLANAVVLPVTLPSDAHVAAYWMGRMMRPGMDVLEVTSTGIKVDPMMFLQMRAYQVAVLHSDTTFPWVRLTYPKSGGGWAVTKFRLKNPTWWANFKASFQPNVPLDFHVPPTATYDQALGMPPFMVPFMPPAPDAMSAVRATLGTVTSADLETATETVPSTITEAMQFNATLQASNNP